MHTASMKALNPAAYTLTAVLLSQYAYCRIRRDATELIVWLHRFSIADADNENSADICIDLLRAAYDVAASPWHERQSTFWYLNETPRGALKLVRDMYYKR